MYFYKTKNVPYSLANEKMLIKYFKIMRRFGLNRWFEDDFPHA